MRKAMKIIDPSVELINPTPYDVALNTIEIAGRTCYQSEDKMPAGTAEDFIRRIIRRIIKRSHESVLEHISVTARFVCDRGVSHEIVRHRIAAYSQESTRYCNYSGDKFENEITVIRPSFLPSYGVRYAIWCASMQYAEDAYFDFLNAGAAPQEARSVLPNSLKTTIVVTYNLREWRHFFRLRCDPDAHPQMQQVAKMTLNLMKEKYWVFFEDLEG